MRIDYPKSVGISIVGWSVSISNMLLFVSYYYILLSQQTPAPPRFIDFISMAAVFPHDFLHNYLGSLWLAHLGWMLMITICAFGILLLNQFARMVFIVLCVTHGVVLSYIFLMNRGQPDALEYFFKLYFNLTFIFAYVGFITIPEVRTQFKSPLERWRTHFWFEKKPPVRKASQDAQGYYNLALAYSRLHRDQDAVAALEKAIRINPEDERYHYELGMHHLKQENFSAAIPAFKQVVRINPSHFAATFQLAQLFQREGCAPETVLLLEKAAQLQPNNSLVYRQLGRAQVLLGNSSAAIAAFNKSLQLNPRDAETYYQLGWLYLNKLEKFDEAREALRTAVHLNAANIDGHFQLGLVDLKLGRMKDAVRAFKEVLRQDENHPQALYRLGFTYVALKDLESAQRQSQILRGVDPELADQLSFLISSQRDTSG